MLNLLHRSKLFRSLIAATAGLTVYGGWAFLINHQHGLMVALKAGATQGSYSFILTLCLSFFMEWLFQISDQPKWQFSLTLFTTCGLIYTTSWGVNALAGTPEILLTILPGAIISSLYTLSYTLALFKLQRG